MELRHLRYFMEVVRQGSISRAAEKLFVAQPALSIQIRQLEEELGVRLFVRRARGVDLSDAGAAFAGEAQAILDRVQAAAASASRGGGQADGVTVRIGYVPSCARTLLPAVLKALKKRHAAAALQSREMITAEQLEGIATHRLDAALCRPLKVEPQFKVLAEMDDPYCLALPASHPWASRTEPMPLAQAASEDFISFPRYRLPAFFDRGIALCMDARFSPRLCHEVSTFDNALQLVSLALGVCIVPMSLALCKPPGTVFKRLKGLRRSDKLMLVAPAVNEHPEIAALSAPMQAEMQRMSAKAEKLAC